MNVLLVRPDGIGDEILCLPVASALRRLLPEARITFLSSEYAAPLLAHHPDLDEVWTVTGGESLRDLVALFRRAVDAAVFLKPFKRLMWAAFLARVFGWRARPFFEASEAERERPQTALSAADAADPAGSEAAGR